MSRLDDLPPDQRATLSLLLRRGKSYAEVAELLSINESAVHDRAQVALAVLAPREARELTAERREEIGDYLLDQRPSVAERLATRTYLEGSPQARAWAGAVAAQLETLTDAPLPEIPSGASSGSSPVSRDRPDEPEEASAPIPPPRSSARDADAHQRTPLPSSRVGGGLLLAALIAIVIAAVILISGSGGSSHKSSTAAATSTGGSKSGTSSTAAQSGRASEDKRITLTPPNPASKSIGVAEVLSEGGKYAFYLAAEHIPPTKGQGFFYAVWLYNSPTSHEALSKAPPVGSNGRVQGGALLPADAGKYHKMLLTRETSAQPTSPGPVVLSGPFALR
jgi:hypothetical protein